MAAPDVLSALLITGGVGTLVLGLVKGGSWGWGDPRTIGVLSAGTIVGSGTVSNKDPDGGPGRPVIEGGLGYSCIAEQRMVETIRFGKPQTEFLKFGDRVRIEMPDADGRSIFGAIDQKVARYAPGRGT